MTIGGDSPEFHAAYDYIVGLNLVPGDVIHLCMGDIVPADIGPGFHYVLRSAYTICRGHMSDQN
jgi:hypothetical protein